MNKKSDDDNYSNKSRPWLKWLANMLTRKPQNREQLMKVLQDAEEHGVLSSEMLGMIERILQVSEMRVREIMVPKAQMIMIKSTSNLEGLLAIVIESGHSRFPVYNPDDGDITGILLAKDLLPFPFKKNINDFHVDDILRPAIFTPQSKRLDILLREFRTNRNHIAIVLDEFGHVAGLVTIEDVLEQIVGEIEDEYDIDEDDTSIKKHDDDTFIVKAKTTVNEFNSCFSTKINGETLDTIGNLVQEHFDHLPKRGETILIKPFRFKVLHSDNRRIHLLEVKRLSNN